MVRPISKILTVEHGVIQFILAVILVRNLFYWPDSEYHRKYEIQICSSDNQGDCHKFFVDATIADNIVATFWNAVTWIFMIFTFNENEIEYIKFKLPMNIGIALITSDFFDEFPQSMEEIWQYVGTDLITEYLRLKFIKEFMIFIISNGWMADIAAWIVGQFVRIFLYLNSLVPNPQIIKESKRYSIQEFYEKMSFDFS